MANKITVYRRINEYIHIVSLSLQDDPIVSNLRELLTINNTDNLTDEIYTRFKSSIALFFYSVVNVSMEHKQARLSRDYMRKIK